MHITIYIKVIYDIFNILNIIFCMKVTGETFSFIKTRKKRSRKGKIRQVSKLSGKRTVPGQNSGQLYDKKHRRGNS